MKGIFILLLIIKMVLSAPEDNDRIDFENFKQKFSKNYNGSEEENRFGIFKRKLQMIKAQNKLYELGKVSFKMDLNAHVDLSDEEFIKYRTGFIPTEEPTLITKFKRKNRLTKDFYFIRSPNPVDLDWRTKGVVGPVKDQQKCGSCWAFASTASLESIWAIKYNNLPNLSEQNLIDCSFAQGNYGCNGGVTAWAFEYIRVNNGINNEQNYPYEAELGACRFNPLDVSATSDGSVRTLYGDESALERAVATVGPVTVAVDASSSFQVYSSGIFQSIACNKTVNHALTVVGYNNTNNPPYWIAKNSWGTQWGEDGYIRIEKNVNACGISKQVFYPIV